MLFAPRALLGALGVCLAIAGAPARAETQAEFFKGKTIRLVNGGLQSLLHARCNPA
jgi:hypothetical protein